MNKISTSLSGVTELMEKGKQVFVPLQILHLGFVLIKIAWLLVLLKKKITKQKKNLAKTKETNNCDKELPSSWKL